MTKIMITALLLVITNTFSQSFDEIKTTSLIYSVDNIEELETIDWKGTKEFFEGNKEDEEVTLGIKIKELSNNESKVKTKQSFEIKGKVKDLDKLITMMKKYQIRTITKVKPKSLIYTVDTVEELKNIDWTKAKTFFKSHDENQEITLGCKVKQAKKENSKLDVKQSFIISAKAKELDKLIKIMMNYTSSQKK
ncbi:hypothetical protein [Tenacibaculum jejuense]|uniref:Uncharacterized protein n=1 Tax=Tenacibaculum jejuense TaxID=584609 RepID=A0A238UFW0_9FLAO|nr:hypothetical protein [Tenacibaculum jejuense]SNR17334.1 protein of unknown function [Tenacibaculum jejuense]